MSGDAITISGAPGLRRLIGSNRNRSPQSSTICISQRHLVFGGQTHCAGAAPVSVPNE